MKMTAAKIKKATPEEIIEVFELSYAEENGVKRMRVPSGSKLGKAVLEALKERKPDLMNLLEKKYEEEKVIAEKRKLEQERLAAEKAAQLEMEMDATDAMITESTLIRVTHRTGSNYLVGLADIASASRIAKRLQKELNEFDRKATAIHELLKPYSEGCDWGDYSITEYFAVPYGELVKIIKILEEDFLKKAEEEQKAIAAKEAARAAKFAEAKQTGQPVILNRWTEPCNNPREECSWDSMYQYAMPDGSIKTVRNHTY